MEQGRGFSFEVYMCKAKNVPETHILHLLALIFTLFDTDKNLTWVKIQLCPNLEEKVLRGQKSKICPFSSQSTENQKLYNISKNQPPK